MLPVSHPLLRPAGGWEEGAGRMRLGGGGWEEEAGRRKLGGGSWEEEAGGRRLGGGGLPATLSPASRPTAAEPAPRHRCVGALVRWCGGGEVGPRGLRRRLYLLGKGRRGKVGGRRGLRRRLIRVAVACVFSARRPAPHKIRKHEQQHKRAGGVSGVSPDGRRSGSQRQGPSILPRNIIVRQPSAIQVAQDFPNKSKSETPARQGVVAKPSRANLIKGGRREGPARRREHPQTRFEIELSPFRKPLPRLALQSASCKLQSRPTLKTGANRLATTAARWRSYFSIHFKQ